MKANVHFKDVNMFTWSWTYLFLTWVVWLFHKFIEWVSSAGVVGPLDTAIKPLECKTHVCHLCTWVDTSTVWPSTRISRQVTLDSSQILHIRGLTKPCFPEPDSSCQNQLLAKTCCREFQTLALTDRCRWAYKHTKFQMCLLEQELRKPYPVTAIPLSQLDVAYLMHTKFHKCFLEQ